MISVIPGHPRLIHIRTAAVKTVYCVVQTAGKLSFLEAIPFTDQEHASVTHPLTTDHRFGDGTSWNLLVMTYLYIQRDSANGGNMWQKKLSFCMFVCLCIPDGAVNMLKMLKYLNNFCFFCVVCACSRFSVNRSVLGSYARKLRIFTINLQSLVQMLCGKNEKQDF